jgi:predicted DNA-binding transcriptional regulator YafY
MAEYRGDVEQSRERQAALLFALESATKSRPLTLETIIDSLKVDEYPAVKGRQRKVPAYEGSPEAIRQKFERDKDAIRSQGIEIQRVTLDNSQGGYWVDPNAHYAPTMDFTPEEERVVAAALQFCSFGLSGASMVFSDRPVREGGLEVSFAYGVVVRAIAARQSISFEYRGPKETKSRIVTPIKIAMFSGASYLIARDEKDDTIKGFRFNRMSKTPETLGPAPALSSDEIEAADHWRPSFAKEEEPVSVEIATNEATAVLIERRYPDAIAKRKKSGTATLTIEFDSVRAAMRFLLEAADRVELVGPKAMRSDFSRWLDQVNQRTTISLPNVRFEPRPKVNTLGQTIQILQAIRNAVEIRPSELAKRFQLPQAQVRDILERLYTMEAMARGGDYGEQYPAHLSKIWEDDETDDPIYESDFSNINLAVNDRRLTWNDLFEINVALREVARAKIDPAIESAIAKIEAKVSHVLDIEHDGNDSIVPQLRQAIHDDQAVKIRYAGAFESEPVIRTVEPSELQVLNGRVYMRAWCRNREDYRNFRTDRIVEILAVEPRGHARYLDPSPDWLTGVSNQGDLVTVVVQHDTRWLFESLPGAEWASLPTGEMAVRFHVADQRFLDQLMLQAGPGASVVSDDPALRRAGHDLAKHLAARLK